MIIPQGLIQKAFLVPAVSESTKKLVMPSDIPHWLVMINIFHCCLCQMVGDNNSQLGLMDNF